MQERYCETGKQDRREVEHISELMGRSLGSVIAMSKELGEKLAKIKDCPAPCYDGMVKITLASGQTRKVSCPIVGLGKKCLYGELMGQGFDRYIMGVMSGIGVPRRHVENLLKAYKTELMPEIAEWPVSGFLIFTGGTGSGKSFGAAMAVYKYLIGLVADYLDRHRWDIADRAAKSVFWCAASDVCEDREVTARVKRERLTVIDDLGGEADTAMWRNTLSGVIMRRHDMKLPTIITTTLTMLDIDIRYGGRVTDRLTEDAGKGGMIIECGNASLRNAVPFEPGLEQ